MNHAEADEVNKLLLTLWDKAVGTSDYDKAQWQRFQELLNGVCPPPLPQQQKQKQTRADLEVSVEPTREDSDVDAQQLRCDGAHRLVEQDNQDLIDRRE